jgi:hypothetical protein
MSRDSAVGITTGYGLEDRGVGVRVPVGSRIFSSPRSPDLLCGPPNLLFNGYRGLFPWGLSGRGVKLTTHLKLVPESRKVHLLVYIHSPIRFHGVVLNYLSIGKTLPFYIYYKGLEKYFDIRNTNWMVYKVRWNLAQDRRKYWAFVLAVLKFWGPLSMPFHTKNDWSPVTWCSRLSW